MESSSRSAAVNYRTAAGALAAVLMAVAAFVLGGMHADITANRGALVATKVRAARLEERLEAVETQLAITRRIITERIEIQQPDRGR